MESHGIRPYRLDDPVDEEEYEVEATKRQIDEEIHKAANETSSRTLSMKPKKTQRLEASMTSTLQRSTMVKKMKR